MRLIKYWYENLQLYYTTDAHCFDTHVVLLVAQISSVEYLKHLVDNNCQQNID